MFKRVFPELFCTKISPQSREQLSDLLELLEGNLVELKQCIHSKKFQKMMSSIDEILGHKITSDRPRPHHMLKELQDLEWLSPSNIRNVISRLKVWNEDIENRTLQIKAEEISKYTQYIGDRPCEVLADVHTNNILIGDFPKIRRTTVGQYLLLYNKPIPSRTSYLT